MSLGSKDECYGEYYSKEYSDCADCGSQEYEESEEYEKTIETKSKPIDPTKKIIIKKRKEFFFNDDPSKPVLAAGLILYRMNESKMHLLMVSDPKISDIGGKVEHIDKSVHETVVREVLEETNNILSITLDRLKNCTQIYIPSSKYVIHILKANDSEKNLSSSDFGDKEINDSDKSLKRDIIWIDLTTMFSPLFVKSKLNPRVMSKDLRSRLKSLESNDKFSKKLF